MCRGLVLLCLALLGACAPQGGTSVRPRIVWPVAPYESRIEYVGVFRTEKDLQPFSEWERFLDHLLSRTSAFRFQRPFGVAVDKRGTVLIGDAQAANVRRFDFSARRVEWFAPGFAFRRPMGLAVDGRGDVYVADGGRGVVLVFDESGRYLRSIGQDCLQNPSYLAINRSLQRLYVADGTNQTILVFSCSGEFLFEFGGAGSAPGRFAVPQGVAIDEAGRIFVADMLNARIQVFTADGSYLYAFGVQGAEYWNFENPRGLCLTSDGLLHIVDFRKGLLLGYTREGEFVYALGKDGQRTSHPLAFSTPIALAEDAQGRLYIIDQLNKRISVWQLLTEAYLAGHPIAKLVSN